MSGRALAELRGVLLRGQTALIAAGLALAVIGLAARLPGDANWDLRNYHLYNPFALLHGKWAVDIAPAGQQSYFMPTLDLPYYLLVRRVSSVPLLNALLALPHAACVVLSFLIALRLLRAESLPRRLLAGLATLLGATGAAMLPTLATSMSDSLPVGLVLAAILLLLRGAEASAGLASRRTVLAGSLAGVALALKLTLLPAVLGLAAAAAVLAGRRTRWTMLAGLAAGGLAGVVAAGGWWWWRVWQEWGNPIFPLFNQVFRSPLVPPVSFEDGRFLPHGIGQFLSFPFILALKTQTLMSEVPARDPRIALALVAAVLLLLRLWRGTGPAALAAGPAVLPARALSVFFLVAYGVWEVEFGVLRYLSGIELLSGPLIAAALLAFAPALRHGTGLALACLACLFALTQNATVYPQWGRARREDRPIKVTMPRLPNDAMVLVLDGDPMAYLAAYQPASVRFLGANGNLVHPDPTQPGQGLRDRIVAAIAAQRGPIWGLDSPKVHPGEADAALAFYRLRRAGPCQAVGSNVDWEGLRLCPLERRPDPGRPGPTGTPQSEGAAAAQDPAAGSGGGPDAARR